METSTVGMDTKHANTVTESSDMATKGADMATKGADMATEGADIATKGADMATKGADMATKGADIATKGADMATKGADIDGKGAYTVAKGADKATTDAGMSTKDAEMSTIDADMPKIDEDIPTKAGEGTSTVEADSCTVSAVRTEPTDSMVAKNVRDNTTIIIDNKTTTTTDKESMTLADDVEPVVSTTSDGEPACVPTAGVEPATTGVKVTKRHVGYSTSPEKTTADDSLSAYRSPVTSTRNLENGISFAVNRTTPGNSGQKVICSPCCGYEHSEKIKYTAFVFVVNIALGALFSVTPTAFLDLLHQTQTDIEQGSFIFMMSSLGYTAGCLISGHLYDKLSADVIFSCSVILAGFFVIFVPLSSSLPTVIALLCLSRMFQGSLDSGTILLCARIWGNEANPYQQASTFFYAIGGIVTPFMMQPFLLVLDYPVTNSSIHRNQTLLAQNLNYQIDYARGNSSWEPTSEAGSGLFVPFLAVGLFSVATSLPFVVKCLQSCNRCRVHDTIEQSSDTTELANPVSGKIVFLMLFLLGAFFMAYGYLLGLGEYSMPFSVDYLGWTKKEGTRLSSVTWSALGVGCFIGIFVARVLRPSYMVLMTLTPITLGLLVMLLASHTSDTVVWVCYVFVFAGVGSIYPAAVSWVDQGLIRVNGKICSLFTVTISLGDVTNSLLLGYLFNNDSYMWYIYLTLGSSVVQWLMLLALYSMKFAKSGKLPLSDPYSAEIEAERPSN